MNQKLVADIVRIAHIFFNVVPIVFIVLGAIVLIVIKRRMVSFSQTGAGRGASTKIQDYGWRIPMIPYKDHAKTGPSFGVRVLTCVKVLGLLGFVAGIFLMSHKRQWQIVNGIELSITSFLTLIISTWLAVRWERRGWEVVDAHCVDRELRRLSGSKGGWIWCWRIICEHNRFGPKLRVTPGMSWQGFRSEKSAIKYLEKRIRSDGACKLRVNPENPYQTDMFP